MSKLTDYLTATARSLSTCLTEAARRAGEDSEYPDKCGFHELRETEEGPPLFYTEICPNGIYLIGVVSSKSGSNSGERRESK